MQFSKQTVSLTSATQGDLPFSFDLVNSAWVSRVGLNYRWDDARNAYAASTAGEERRLSLRSAAL